MPAIPLPFLWDLVNLNIDSHLLKPTEMGIGKVMGIIPRRTLSLLVFLVIVAAAAGKISDSATDSDQRNTLLNFRSSLSNAAALSNWNANTNICHGNSSNWKGVICLNDAFFGLRLENMSLGGNIDVESLSQLQGLKTLSFNNNSFSGLIPPLSRIGGLRGIFLSYNNFSGEIPDGFFTGMNSLRKVELGHNGFVGRIPQSLAGLSKVNVVKLNDNQFDGRIPYFKNKDGISLNFTNNKLEGPIPKTMRAMDPSLFAGNPGLCGGPLIKQCKKKSMKKLVLIVIVVALAVASIAALTMAFLIFQKKRRSSKLAKLGKKEIRGVNCCYKGSSRGEEQDQSPDTYKKAHQNGKLQFVRNDSSENFELGELLSASAEVLGSGSFGSSYKATLFNGRTVVVKRFRQMKNCGKEEFNQHMKRLGRISHPNLLPLIAFYYRKQETLLVSDFALNGSLASHLHGNTKKGKQSGLGWPIRLKIIKGIARGLVHLHKELPNQSLPHGHLKSSNVLLTSNFDPLLSDYSLEPVLNKEHAQNFMVAYKSPESSPNNNVGPGRKTDVWSLGILILEALTGRFPANYLKQGRGSHADLASWVDAVVREEWTGEVFDVGMKETKDGEGEMLRLLKIGMCCCELDVEKRWELGMVLEKIEELKERDSEEFDSSSYGTEGDSSSYSPHNNHIHHDHDNNDNEEDDKGLTDHEDFTFSVQK